MKKIFISASNTGVGKTHTALSLIDSLSKEGARVGVFKPIETGVNGAPQDATALLSACKKANPDFDFSIDDVCPYQFSLPAAPSVAKKGLDIDLDFLKEKADELSKKCDVLLIEGAGGLYTPIEQEFFMIDLAALLAGSVLYVVHSGLGCINDAMIGAKALEAKELDYTLCINLHREKESFFEVSYPFFEKFVQKSFMLQNDLDELSRSISKDCQ